MEKEPVNTETATVEPVEKKVRLVDIPVTNPNEALNMIVTFLNLAQKRGTFTIDEAAKIWECVKYFQPSEGQS